jgi:hypothetical protein
MEHLVTIESNPNDFIDAWEAGPGLMLRIAEEVLPPGASDIVKVYNEAADALIYFVNETSKCRAVTMLLEYLEAEGQLPSGVGGINFVAGGKFCGFRCKCDGPNSKGFTVLCKRNAADSWEETTCAPGAGVAGGSGAFCRRYCKCKFAKAQRQ